MEAMAFMHFILGYDLQEVNESRRLKGFAVEQMSRLGLRKLSPLVHSNLIGAWERDVAEDRLPDTEFVFVSSALLLLAFRARFSDLEQVKEFTLDEARGQLEATVERTKTSGSNKDRLPLKLFGVVELVSGLDW
eukprot:3524537-Karenia_brevis.AAC.2